MAANSTSPKTSRRSSNTKTTKSNVAKKPNGRTGFLVNRPRFDWKIAAIIGVIIVVALGYLYVRLSSAASTASSSTVSYSLTGSNAQIISGKKLPKSNGATAVEDANGKLSIALKNQQNTAQKTEWCLVFSASAGVRLQGGYKPSNQSRVVKLNKGFSSQTGKTKDCFWLEADINSRKENVWFELTGGDSIAWTIQSSSLAAVQKNTAQKNATTTSSTTPSPSTTPGTKPSSTPSSTPTPVNTGLCGGTNTWQQGSSGDCVKLIQKRLSDLGYDPGPIDGIYGEKTYNAVKVFESKNGMTVDGVVDTRTWSMLFSADPVRKQ